MKGIVLAGGKATRLYPITYGVSKQLLPIYDKPMIYYPISTLMLAGIREILIIVKSEDIDAFQRLLGDGTNYGIKIEYAIQDNPNGLAEALIIGEKFINNEPCCLVLGDNIFHGANFSKLLKSAKYEANDGNAVIFGYHVSDPSRYGVAEVDCNGRCISIEEKPSIPKSDLAVPGLYFYPSGVSEMAKQVKPSSRGELEITTLNEMYMNQDKLLLTELPLGFAWLDTGTFDSLSEASNYVETIEKRTGLQIACLEEIAFKKKWVSRNWLINTHCSNPYNDYLRKVANLKK